jgi:hypothetical protein
VEGDRIKENGEEAQIWWKYYVLMCENRKMRLLKPFPEWGKKKRMMELVNSSMKYCKDF